MRLSKPQKQRMVQQIQLKGILNIVAEAAQQAMDSKVTGQEGQTSQGLRETKEDF